MGHFGGGTINKRTIIILTKGSDHKKVLLNNIYTC